MSIDEFLSNLERRGVRIWADGESLRYDAPSELITADFLTELRERKGDLLAFLHGAERMSGAQLAPIPKSPRSGGMPLSFAQRRLWFMNKLAPSSPFYNVPVALRLTGPLDRAALRRSLDGLLERHEALRTVIKTVADEPLQFVCPPQPVVLTEENLTSLPQEERDMEARRLIAAEVQRPFDLTRELPLRAHLLRLDEGEHVLVLTMHHIATDGWSIGVLLQDLARLYEASIAGQPARLAPLPIQYADFAVWQRQWLEGEVLTSQLNYWRRQLADLAILQLPTDHLRPERQSFRGSREMLVLSEELTSALKELGRHEGATLYMLLLAAFASLLHRYTGQEDIVVGSPVANRNRSELENLIGFFVNSLVMRTSVDDGASFRELVAQVRETTLGAFANQDLPFERLVEDLHPDRALAHNPLFQVVLAVQNAPVSQETIGDLKAGLMWGDTLASRFDLEIHVWEEKTALRIYFVYSTDLFERPTIRRMADHFESLLTALVAKPDQPLFTFDILTDAERHQLLEWNGPVANYPREKCIHELFEEQAARSPESVAIVFGDQELTYGELNERANRLAHYLIKQGVGPETSVALFAGRSLNLVVGLLGILKAGGAYLPLDPNYPQARLDFMVQDSRPKVLLTSPDTGTSWSSATVTTLSLDAENLAKESSLNPGSEVTSRNLAYVIYTSGSTGEPKGVLIAHRSMVNLVAWHQHAFALSGNDRTIQITSPAFDAAGWELWPYLLCGATVCIPNESVRASAEALRAWLIAHGITICFLPTVLAESLLRLEWPPETRLRLLLTGGDRLRLCPLQTIPFKVVNNYGPTETTVVATSGTVEARDGEDLLPSIGRPIFNTEAYILDPRLRRVPVGAAGELYIGGDGLARGYLNRPELTAEKFIRHPFSSDPQARLYRTGDRARYLANGNIQFLDRLDNQVKIRGYRIELGEIEAVLNRHPGVREAVVLAQDDSVGTDGRSSSAGKRLVGYVVPNDEVACDAGAVSLNTSAVESYVDGWRELYDRLYREASSGESDPEFNISGWNSSYTGEPLPAAQMRGWLDGTIRRIRNGAPRRVLEIGCGSGLVLFGLAPFCDAYVATDFSRAALEYVQGVIRSQDKFANVTLLQRMADDLSGIEKRSFDTVILNSVTQYLPSGEYLRRVLQSAVEVLRPGGRIFIGDVRSFPLLRAFHASVEFERAAGSMDKAELANRISRSIGRESELLIDPAYFQALRRLAPRITDVDVMLKRGDYQNELTCFRYDVVLHIDSKIEPSTIDRRVEWGCEIASLDGIRKLLSSRSITALEVLNVPNARLVREVGVLDWLANVGGAKNVAALRSELDSKSPVAIDPETLWRMAAELNYALECRDSGSVGFMDALFRLRHGSDGNSAHWYRPPDHDEPDHDEIEVWDAYTSVPLTAAVVARLAPSLREFSKQRLPAYMVPSAFIILDALPLTVNGKIDRHALLASERTRPEPERSFMAPRTPAERLLVEIWREVLDLEKIGIRDNFFDLGGHSLLATQVLSGIRRAFRLELPLSAMFEKPTIEGLAKAITEKQAEGEQELANLLAELGPASDGDSE